MAQEEKKVQTLLDIKTKVEGEARRLAQDKEFRKGIEDSPLEIAKAHDALLLYLLILGMNQLERRLKESIQSLSDGMLLNMEDLRRSLFDTQNRTKTIETALRANITRDDQARNQMLADLANKIGKIESSLDEKMSASFSSSTRSMKETEDHILEPLRSMVRDLADSYKITSRTNLMMTEITRKLNDISADIGAMEEAMRIEMAETLREEMGKATAQGLAKPDQEQVAVLVRSVSELRIKLDSALLLLNEVAKASAEQPKAKKKEKSQEG
jgi:hypothetical protein